MRTLLESVTAILLSTSAMTQLSGIVVSGAMSVMVPGEDTGFSRDGGVGYILDNSDGAAKRENISFRFWHKASKFRVKG